MVLLYHSVWIDPGAHTYGTVGSRVRLNRVLKHSRNCGPVVSITSYIFDVKPFMYSQILASSFFAKLFNWFNYFFDFINKIEKIPTKTNPIFSLWKMNNSLGLLHRKSFPQTHRK